MALPQLSKLMTGVRFPLLAPPRRRAAKRYCLAEKFSFPLRLKSLACAKTKKIICLKNMLYNI
ncbi:MAG: hypothetical protein Athens071426_190 [Parcubacteria group bacterium Athens0714_26]|nr:MAG: hypothetical protein Athens071426_190 [Parcubacteria group bacterium Athens0714_26]